MSEQPDWLGEKPLQQFFAATRAAGGEARAVGGAVRDWLMGIASADVDIASSLLPEQTMEIAAQQSWKAIPTGIDHGTVTLVLTGGRIVEVTTLRRDVATDGRHATVAFTQDWKADAGRRDFTINAMSMDVSGTLHDYFDGQKDIAGKRVRFIGDAATRIKEDGLRSLRFFRFLATHGGPPADEDALAAISANKNMLEHVSGERIANEMRKLLACANPAFTLRMMSQAGIAPLIFGRSIEPSVMIRLQMLEAQADYQASVWARALALLGPPSPEKREERFSTSPKGEVSPVTPQGWLTERWKLSRHETKQLYTLGGLPAFDAGAPKHAHTRILRLHGAPVYLDWLLMNAALAQGIDITPHVQLAKDFKPVPFPVNAKDLIARGMTEGKELGDALAALETKWEESSYKLTKEQLLT